MSALGPVHTGLVVQLDVVVQPRLWSRAERRQLVRRSGEQLLQNPDASQTPAWPAAVRVGLGFLERGGGGWLSSVPLTHLSASVEPSPTEEELKPPNRYLMKESVSSRPEEKKSSLFLLRSGLKSLLVALWAENRGCHGYQACQDSGWAPPSESEAGGHC